LSRYILIRRLRGPAFLLLVGVMALMAQAHILGWDKSWPLFLILGGVIALAERAALAAEGGVPPAPYPGTPYAGPYAGPYQNPAPGQYPGGPNAGAPPAGTTDPVAPQYPGQAATQTGSAIVPASSREMEKFSNGGQS
jgi:hypothetical protein